MGNTIEAGKLDGILGELDDTLKELNSQLLDIICNINLSISLSEAKKKMGIDLASSSGDAIIALQNMKQEGKISEKAAKNLQAGAAIVGFGALIYTAFTSFKESSQVVDFIKQVKSMDDSRKELIITNLDKINVLLTEFEDAIENKIIKSIDFLSNQRVFDDRAANITQKLDQFVIRYMDFTQKYLVFDSYKQNIDRYIDREVFSFDLSTEAMEDAKRRFADEMAALFDRMKKIHEPTIGSQYLIANDKALHKAMEIREDEILKTASGKTITLEEFKSAVVLLSQYIKKYPSNETDQRILKYISGFFNEDQVIKENLSEFDMQVFKSLVDWCRSAPKMGRKCAVALTFIYSLIAVFTWPVLLIVSPFIYKFTKKRTAHITLINRSHKDRLEHLFGEGTAYNYWMRERLDEHGFGVRLARLFKQA